MRCPDREFCVKVDPNWPDGKSGIIRKLKKKLKKFYEEVMIFDEIRGHSVILPFYRAQTRRSDGPLRKRAMKSEVEVVDTPNFQITRLIWWN